MIGLMLMGVLGVVVVMVGASLVMLQLMAETLAERTQAARIATVAVRAPALALEEAPVSQRLRSLYAAVEEAPLSQRFSVLPA